MRKTKTIFFASSNKDKLKEIKSIWPLKNIRIKGAPKNFTVKENGKSFIENAYKKASALSKKLKCISFSDDSGIEVAGLGMKPGIKSSRFFRSGKGMLEIIKKIRKKKNKKCCFTCAIVATNPKGELIFKIQKSWHGTVAEKPRGSNGFGYDPIFVIARINKTSAQISSKLKNKISHRAMALKEFAKWLTKTDVFYSHHLFH